MFYDWDSIKAVCLQTIVIDKHDYVHFVVGFTNFWAQLYIENNEKLCDTVDNYKNVPLM